MKSNLSRFKWILSFFLYAVVISLVGLVLGSLVASAVASYDEEKELWDKENKCIAEHIRQGVERKDIARDRGACYVK